jgi:hypothetical protein
VKFATKFDIYSILGKLVARFALLTWSKGCHVKFYWVPLKVFENFLARYATSHTPTSNATQMSKSHKTYFVNFSMTLNKNIKPIVQTSFFSSIWCRSIDLSIIHLINPKHEFVCVSIRKNLFCFEGVSGYGRDIRWKCVCVCYMRDLLMVLQQQKKRYRVSYSL